jgi:hypothetical protein
VQEVVATEHVFDAEEIAVDSAKTGTDA